MVPTAQQQESKPRLPSRLIMVLLPVKRLPLDALDVVKSSMSRSRMCLSDSVVAILDLGGTILYDNGEI